MDLRVANANLSKITKKRFNNPFKIKTQSINFTMINNIIKKYNLDPTQIKEDELFNKKIFKDLRVV